MMHAHVSVCLSELSIYRTDIYRNHVRAQSKVPLHGACQQPLRPSLCLHWLLSYLCAQHAAPQYICKGPHRGQQPLSQLLALKRPEKKITQHKTALLNTSARPKLHTHSGRMQHRPWCRILPTLMREGSVAPASKNWRTVLGLTPRTHTSCYCAGVKGSALKVGTLLLG